jgi:hypothetical protein
MPAARAATACLQKPQQKIFLADSTLLWPRQGRSPHTLRVHAGLKAQQRNNRPFAAASKKRQVPSMSLLKVKDHSL